MDLVTTLNKLEYDDETIQDIDLQEDLVSGVAFEYCLFKNCSFAKTRFEFCTFTECTFEGCDLSLIGVKGSVFNDVTLINSKAIGIDFSQTINPFELSIETSNISMSSFYTLDLRHIKVVDSQAIDVDFSRVNLEKSNFTNTDLSGATFSDTKLKYADFSKARNYFIDPKKNDIRAMKVSLPEAGSFLLHLGLKLV